MFDMGLWEIVLICVILLIVVGPERLPRLARTAGLWVGKARSMVASVRTEVERELRVEELKRSIREQTDSDEFRDLADQVRSINSEARRAEHDMHSDLDRDAARSEAPASTNTGATRSGSDSPAAATGDPDPSRTPAEPRSTDSKAD